MANDSLPSSVPTDYEQVLAFLAANWVKTTRSDPVREYPFDQLRRLLGRMGSPERHGLYVGVTGSKGKGSIARLTADILRAHGLRVGLFTSPHLVRVEERIDFDGQPIPPGPFARRFAAALIEQRGAGLEELGITPLLLALALAYFRDQESDVGVLEVRAGGRFDPTAVVHANAVCIGPIGLEHVPGLGYSLSEIAWQKAGLVKMGSTCFSAHQFPEADRVIERECASVGAALHRIGGALGARVQARSERGQHIALRTPWGSFEGLELSLMGEHQAENAALAAGAAGQILDRLGRPLDGGALAEATSKVRWPARLERLRDEPILLYDGAHTGESAAALASALAAHYPGRSWTFVMGILAGKDLRAILTPLRPVAARLLTVPIAGFHHYDPDVLANRGRDMGMDATAFRDPAAAFELAASWDEPVCVTGTLYLYNAALAAARGGRSS